MRFSLKKKTTLLIVSIVLLVSAVSLICCNRVTSQIVQRQFMGKAASLAQTVTTVVNTSQVRELRESVGQIYQTAEEKIPMETRGITAYDAYMSRFQEVQRLPSFHHIQKQLQSIQELNGLSDVYLFFVDHANSCMVYLVDGAERNGYPPGCVKPVSGPARIIFDDPAGGFPPSVVESEDQGALVSAARPIYDRNGSILAYAGVDLPMTSVTDLVRQFILFTALALAILSAILCVIAVLLVDRLVVQPINTLSEASVTYCSEDASTIRHTFSLLRIRTGDEIQTLAESMARMERDINDRIAALLAATQELTATREQAQELSVIASVDALTKVRNKRAYDREAARLEESIRAGGAVFGIAMIDLNNLKALNDTYGHEKGDIAIRTLCGHICETFRRSPVFRIGGDEFVVILEDHDYANAQELVERFNDALERDDPVLPPWENVSAAIGYAAFEQERDRSVDAVFKRADRAMYARKRAMKAARH